MPAQLKLPLGCTVTPTEADLRAVFDRTQLSMTFSRAMAETPVARCLMAAARARITARRGRRRG